MLRFSVRSFFKGSPCQKNILKTFLTSTQGFTLIEVAIALSILGILATASLPFLTSSLTHARHRTTREHQQIILQALGTYLARQNTLPCPAEPTAQGVARKTCLSAIQADGLVPYRTLGLPAQMALDGWKHPLRYVVEPQLTTASSTNRMSSQKSLHSFSNSQYCVYGDVAHQRPTLTVTGAQGEPVIDPGYKKDFVAVILISHGAQGIGAPQTTLPTSKLHPHKKENADSNGKYVSDSDITEPDTVFDDIVIWESRNNLAARYAHTVCRGD